MGGRRLTSLATKDNQENTSDNMRQEFRFDEMRESPFDNRPVYSQ